MQQPIANGSRKLRWFDARITPPSGHVLGAEPAEPEVDEDGRLDDPPHRPVHERVDAAASRALVVALQGACGPSTQTLPGSAQSALRCARWSFGDTLNGALAGAAAAGGLGRPAAARQAGVRLPLRRRGAARQARHARTRLAGGRAWAPRGQRRGVRRRLRAGAAARAGPAAGGRRRRGDGRALRLLAARHPGGPLPPGAQGAGAAARATAAPSPRPPGATSCSASSCPSWSAA